MKNFDQFIGSQFTWFIGEVLDVSDPLLSNRVKVMPYGFYDETIPKEKLNWSTVMMPNTSSSFKGFGSNHELMVGSWVVGFFRDGPSAQDAIILGSIASTTDGTIDIPVEAQLNPPTNKVHKTEAGHIIEIDNTAGAERVHIKHTSGSFLKMDADGTITMSSSNQTVNIVGNTSITGTLNVSSTTHSVGDVSTDAGNAPTLATHKHVEVPGTGGASSPNPTKQLTSVADESTGL
tara:strand:- start:5540 stop:6241 length:702 start_codon:yes stop_codon:yes gene_type:complete